MNTPDDHLVVLATFQDPHQAHAVRLCLEAEGIQSKLDGEHHITMDWLVSNAIGGVKLLIHERDFEASNRILQSKAPEISDEQTGDATEVDATDACCPSCGSSDIYRERMKRHLVLISILLLGIPLPFLSRKIVCESCRHRWIIN